MSTTGYIYIYKINLKIGDILIKRGCGFVCALCLKKTISVRYRPKVLKIAVNQGDFLKLQSVKMVCALKNYKDSFGRFQLLVNYYSLAWFLVSKAHSLQDRY